MIANAKGRNKEISPIVYLSCLTDARENANDIIRPSFDIVTGRVPGPERENIPVRSNKNIYGSN